MSRPGCTGGAINEDCITLIALISDIHSNVLALEAVLRDVKSQGAEHVY